MNILLLSPYHSGSHRAWVDGWLAHTEHDVRVLSLPGRFWKWRMQGAAVTLAQQFRAAPRPQPDAIVVDDMLDLPTFLALTRRETAGVPVVLYMHENQITYPLPQNPRQGPMRRNWGVRERAYGLINWKSMMAADEIWFNSQFHLASWFEALPRFLRHYQEYDGRETIPDLHEKSRVMPIGVVPPPRPSINPFATSGPPLILWNQRWEYDKNPAGLFEALSQVQARGSSFRLALCGENFQTTPQLFLDFKEQFAAELIHFGFADRATYLALLWAADLTISTAFHEFFGIGSVEAMMAETMVLLPHRLSYPELLPTDCHDRCLYHTSVELVNKIISLLEDGEQRTAVAGQLAKHCKTFAADQISVQYDQNLRALGQLS